MGNAIVRKTVSRLSTEGEDVVVCSYENLLQKQIAGGLLFKCSVGQVGSKSDTFGPSITTTDQ